jgi:TRAP-type C4-dicarboxylate transport system permease small subunit
MIRTALDTLYLVAGWLAGGFLVLIFLLMMVLSAGRPLGINIAGGDDIVSWCMAAMAFLGLAHTFRTGEMIRVGLLIDTLSGRTKHAVEIFALVVGCGFVGFFAWHAVTMTWYSWRFGDMTQGVIAIPLWIPQLGFTSGLVILAVALVDELVYVAGGREPRYEKPKPQTAEEVVEQAIQSGV